MAENKWITRIITLLIGVVPPFITIIGGPPCITYQFTLPKTKSSELAPEKPVVGRYIFLFGRSAYVQGRLLLVLGRV